MQEKEGKAWTAKLKRQTHPVSRNITPIICTSVCEKGKASLPFFLASACGRFFVFSFPGWKFTLFSSTCMG